MKIIITGISRGLGKALFTLLAGKTKNIIGIGRTFSKEQYELADANSGISLLSLDLAQPIDNYNFLPSNENIIFIHNAGVVEPIGDIGSMLDENIYASIHVNLLAPILLTNALLRNNKTLTVLNISSGASRRAIEQWSMYCSGKAGCEMFFNVVKMQKNCNVVHIDPGVMDTEMQSIIRDSNCKDRDLFIGLKEDGKLLKPVDVAERIFMEYIKGAEHYEE